MTTVKPEARTEIEPTRPATETPINTEALVNAYEAAMQNGVPPALKKRGFATWTDSEGNFYLAKRDHVSPDEDKRRADKIAVLKVPEHFPGTTINLGRTVTRWALNGLPGSEGLEAPHIVELHRNLKKDHPATAKQSSVFYSDPDGKNTLHLNGGRPASSA